MMCKFARFLGIFCVLLMLIPGNGTALAQSDSPKAPVRGLIDMGDIIFNHTPGLIPVNTTANIEQVPGVFTGKMLNVLWSQLQPTDANTFDFSAIDSGLSAVQAYNARHPDAAVQVILRVFGGPNSPDWVKHLDGDPVTVIHKALEWKTGIAETVGRFWSASYRSQWRALQAALAAQYDDNPLISNVMATSCSSITDESFIIPLDSESQHNMLAAGFTDAQYQDCLLHSVDDYSAWKRSAVEFTFNPYRKLQVKPIQTDEGLAVQVMTNCRTVLGPRCVIGTECLGVCDQSPLYTAIFAQIKTLGAPVSFEPYSPATFSTDMAQADATVDQAVAYGASSLEIWPLKDGFASIPLNHLVAWAKKIQNVP